MSDFSTAVLDHDSKASEQLHGLSLDGLAQEQASPFLADRPTSSPTSEAR